MIENKNNNDPVFLSNKVVVVAGGANKIGKAIAGKLAQTGASIVIADVHLINAEIVVQHLTEKYKTAAAAVGPNIDEIKSIVEEGGIDLWVNAGPLNKNSHDFFALSNEAAGYMKKSKTEGLIINIVPDVDENVPGINKISSIQNHSYGSNFCVNYTVNSFCLSAYGWVNGTEFWEKVLALVLDILSTAVH